MSKDTPGYPSDGVNKNEENENDDEEELEEELEEESDSEGSVLPYGDTPQGPPE